MAFFDAFNSMVDTTRSSVTNYVTENTSIDVGSFVDNGVTSQSILGIDSIVNSRVENYKNRVSQVSGLLEMGGGGAKNVGSMIRKSQNSLQGVENDAIPPKRKIAQARISSPDQTDRSHDWRVSLSVPSVIAEGGVISPLLDKINGYPRMIFPFTPQITMGHSATYNSNSPTHTNYQYHSYENSQINSYIITGEFVNENEQDGEYFIACLHYLRTMTKMFYGDNGSLTGSPPPVCRLNGYGPHVLNNIPVVISEFTTEMPNDVDYIQCVVDDSINFVPTACTIMVTCLPTYARRTQARFNLTDFVSGAYVGGSEGFV